MPLTLLLDHALTILNEPGYWNFFSSRTIAESAAPADSSAAKQYWHDPATDTILLKPLQLQQDWLNSASQLDSILGLSSFNANPADLSSGAIFEASQGNSNNPAIFHAPVSPVISSPNIVPTGFSTPTLLAPIEEQSSTGLGSIFSFPGGANPNAPPMPGDAPVAGKFILETKQRLLANQAMYIRYFFPDPRFTHQCVYMWFIAQFCIVCRSQTMEIYYDKSAHGDRTSWQKLIEAPLFSAADVPRQGSLQPFGMASTAEARMEERAFLFLPYRRQHVLIQASTGKYVLINTSAVPVRNADRSDWQITRSDTLQVWVLNQNPGRFQAQRVKYPSGPVTLNLPHVTTDYAPSVLPTVTINGDYGDHGTAVSGVISTPPPYVLPVRLDVEDESPITTDTTAQTRTYGVRLTLTASSDNRWSPQVYGILITAARSFSSWPAATSTLTDFSPNSRLLRGNVSAGMRPGDGRMEVEILDKQPSFTLSPYYYRSSVPVQLKLSTVPIFTGYTEPIEVVPMRFQVAPRRLRLPGVDRWKQLADTYLRDQRDWTGTGHIDVVDFIFQQAGIDTTSAEYPTPKAAWNQPLGGPNILVDSSLADAIRSGWKPAVNDTAATYLQRIADYFSGFVIGFRLDGTPYYLPRYYFTTSSTTFYMSRKDAIAVLGHPTGDVAPVYRGPVEFRTLEPEANVVQVSAQRALSGDLIRSALYIDWASIKNPAAANFLGRWRLGFFEVGGGFSFPQLNWIARTIWKEARRRRRTVSFTGDFLPGLKIGQIFTLQNYGDYRLTSLRCELRRDTWEQCSYAGEFVEAGV